jgi:hypothetical protein
MNEVINSQLAAAFPSTAKETAETYTVVSKMAYLTGVKKNIFEDENQPPRLEIYEELEQNKSARIIRNLCMIRTAMELNFSDINEAMRYQMKNIDTLPEYIPSQSVQVLQEDGIDLVKSNHLLSKYIIDINKHIAQHISQCKGLFDFWVNWEYIREMFLMPDGYSEQGIRRAANVYYANKQQYPYQVYINWRTGDDGNIFYNDKKFLRLLYSRHGDIFLDNSKVQDAASSVKEDICSYLTSSGKALIIVDCENADPYKFYAMLDKLERRVLLSKVEKVLLINDVHASTAWKCLDRFTDLLVEEHMTTRVLESKSLVDIELVTKLCQEHYENHVDSFVLASSDSDFIGLMKNLPCRFLVMVEQSKCSPATKQALDKEGISYCSMDDFCTDTSSKMKENTLLGEVYDELREIFDVDINAILDKACVSARVQLSETERKRFYERHVRPLRVSFGADGHAMLQSA